jgi:glycosyltransferase involved in cell wall biosynthesis
MPIKIDRIDDGLPVSVIVPLSKNRRNFFENFVLPLIEANNVNEIIVNDDDGRAPKKRNDGFKKSTQPFVFFCDDDILLPANYLQTLYDALQKNPEVGFAYTGYQGIVLHPESHPMRGNFQIPAIQFNANALRRGNYISTMTLVRRELFPMFDENLKRLQDWDVWLTIVENGGKGILVPNLTFFAYYLDIGITSNTNSEIDAINAIRIKHNL